ncbi:uracil-DNA glycosylase [Nocardioides alcanivorans]|uniref:uracil-DNA glycosylase n=1 Tax=Nocardioides alcanivorans TaxID=2897352 RepID=UPI001F3D6FDC|nr:uracil-DNA glycosylase [Nocardioides alcanivorans]
MSEELPHPITGEPFTSPVPAATGWPDDLARPDTPVARSAAGVRRQAAGARDLTELGARVSRCHACPRLVAWREEVATEKRASFRDEPYWGRPVPGWGDPEPGVVVIGLAPAAHGANRTGRNFTGDSSGDWLFASLYRTGFAALPTSRHAGDGQVLTGVRLVSPVRCAPPQNKPTPQERDACAPWIARELELLLPHVQAVVALGAFGWAASLRVLARAGFEVPSPSPRFGHAAEITLARPLGTERVTLLGCYHPSQHNTFTGRLTPEMIDAVLRRAGDLAAGPGPTA